MSDQEENKGRGCLGTLMKLFVMGSVLVLGVAWIFAMVPRDLSDLEGVDPAQATVPPKDIKAVMKGALERGHEIGLSEEEINAYFARTLSANQKGVFGDRATVEGVWVSLEDGLAEIIIQRRVFDYPLTVSVFCQVEQLEQPMGPVKTEIVYHGGPYFPGTYPNKGGKFGRLAVPQGFLLLVRPAFEKLAGAYAEEIGLISDMARIRIEEGRLVLNPHSADELMPFDSMR